MSAACARNWAAVPGTEELIRPIRGSRLFSCRLNRRRGVAYEPPPVLEDLSAFLGGAGVAARRALPASSCTVMHSERPWWTQPSRQVMPQLGLEAAQRLRARQPTCPGWLPERYFGGQPRHLLAAGRRRQGTRTRSRLRSFAANAAETGAAKRRSHADSRIRPLWWPNPYLGSAVSVCGEFVPPPLSERVPGDILWTLKLGTIVSAFCVW